MQHLKVQYNSPMLNSGTITFGITTSATTSAIDRVQHQIVQH